MEVGAGFWNKFCPISGLSRCAHGEELEGYVGTLFHRFLGAMNLMVFFVSVVDSVSCGVIFVLGNMKVQEQGWWLVSGSSSVLPRRHVADPGFKEQEDDPRSTFHKNKWPCGWHASSSAHKALMGRWFFVSEDGKW